MWIEAIIVLVIYHMHMSDLWNDITRWLNIFPAKPVRSLFF